MKEVIGFFLIICFCKLDIEFVFVFVVVLNVVMSGLEGEVVVGFKVVFFDV